MKFLMPMANLVIAPSPILTSLTHSTWATTTDRKQTDSELTDRQLSLILAVGWLGLFRLNFDPPKCERGFPNIIDNLAEWLHLFCISVTG